MTPRAVFLLFPSLLLNQPNLLAQARRVVIVKADGVPGALVAELVAERDPVSGKSQLPWIDEVFGRQGTRMANFYVRGISLSTPSWSMLDTGFDQRIHGNVEYDRFTLRAYDYLNFFPFFFDYAFSRRVDMPGVEVLDEAGTPLLIDRFPYQERLQSFQLFQRGNRWGTVEGALPYHISLRGPRRLLEDSQTGIEVNSSIGEKTEQELILALKDPRLRYLDLFTGDYDHTAHLSNDRQIQIRALKRLDALIGRLWAAIQVTPQASTTILALVSDHGMNTMAGVFSQGFSLVEWFGGASGGGHHVVTNRYPLSEYKLRGLNPFVSEVITSSPVSPYLKDYAQQYPTVLLDLDGNERAAVQLRNNDLNILQMLLLSIAREESRGERRQAKLREFFSILDKRNAEWSRTLEELREEIAALDREIARQRAVLAAIPKNFTTEDRVFGREQTSRRLSGHIRAWEQEKEAYDAYIRVMSRLLALRPGPFDARHADMESLIPKRSLGEANSIYDLQHYAVGPDPGTTINYFAALKGISVRNHIQAAVRPDPVDFIAARTPNNTIDAANDTTDVQELVWLYAGEDRQALVMRRGPLVRYIPIRHLQGQQDGRIHFENADWSDGLPLHLWEDPKLDTKAADRKEWLNAWHTEREWMEALCQTEYSNGVIGVLEQFQTPETRLPEWDRNLPPDEARLLLRLEDRRRKLAAAELLIFANNHWNFNARSLNPGGNHGSFFQPSAHALFMISGGSDTGVPKGLMVEEPYDSLSFVPTLLRLLEIQPKPDEPAFPGPVIHEIVSSPSSEFPRIKSTP